MDFNPEFLQDLLSQECQLSELHAGPIDDMSIDQARVAALMSSLYKKWEPKDSATLETVAIDRFHESNARCKTAFNIANLPTDIQDILKTTRDLMYGYFHCGPFQTNVLTLDSSLSLGRAGPGSSRCTKHTDFYQKMFCGKLSTTSVALYKHYTSNISDEWLLAERFRAKHHQVDVVTGSNLSTVSKNCKTNRTICTEPVLNMFYQLGAGVVIEGITWKFHNINFKDQPDINKQMAKQGSIDGETATIDMTDASDLNSYALVEFLVPPLPFATLQTIRSPSTTYKGKEIQLNMISSMGNGFTFPLMTLMYATLVRATYLHMGIKPRVGKNRNYSVFGDDIICVAKSYETVVRVLEGCGLKVNLTKSFHTGSFRESCGGDFLRGYDIRGVYIRKANNAADIYSIFNRLVRWSCKSGISIPRSLRYLKGLVDFRPIPFDDGDAEGFKVPRDQAGDLKSDKNGALFYRALTVRSRMKTISESDSHFNPWGFAISAIGGYIQPNWTYNAKYKTVGGTVRAQKVSLRLSNPTFKVVRRKTPCWDNVTYPGLTIRDYQLIFQELDHA